MGDGAKVIDEVIENADGEMVSGDGVVGGNGFGQAYLHLSPTASANVAPDLRRMHSSQADASYNNKDFTPRVHSGVGEHIS